MIRPVSSTDAPTIAAIYNYYIENSTATFEETPVPTETMEERIRAIQTRFPYYVYEVNDQILGYAYATEWKPRSAYRFTVESTVYIAKGQHGKQVGTQLYTSILDELRKREVHAVLGGITLPNDSSVALHEKMGFKKIGQLHQVGFKFNQWVDVGYWELIL